MKLPLFVQLLERRISKITWPSVPRLLERRGNEMKLPLFVRLLERRISKLNLPGFAASNSQIQT